MFSSVADAIPVARGMCCSIRLELRWWCKRVRPVQLQQAWQLLCTAFFSIPNVASFAALLLPVCSRKFKKQSSPTVARSSATIDQALNNAAANKRMQKPPLCSPPLGLFARVRR